MVPGGGARHDVEFHGFSGIHRLQEFQPVAERVLRVEPVISRQQLVIDAPAELGRIRIDAAKIRDCVNNLLLNAIKFTPDGGRIELAARRTPGDAAHIRVTDAGVGIDAASLPRLLQPFFTGFDHRHHSSGRFEFGARGMGLGLSTVKAFVEMHGGTVEVASEPGRGTTVEITLPDGGGPGAHRARPPT